MTPALTKFFPRTNHASPGALPRQGRHSTRPIPRCPANTTWLTTPTIPPKGHYTGASSGYVPNLGHIRSHRLHRIPLWIVELRGGLATGLKSLRKDGYAISSYDWVNTYPGAHTVASHRIAYLRLQLPHLLPPEAIKD